MFNNIYDWMFVGILLAGCMSAGIILASSILDMIKEHIKTAKELREEY